jgi:hypothetical protein
MWDITQYSNNVSIVSIVAVEYSTHAQLAVSARTHLDSHLTATAFRISPRDVLFGMSPHHTNNNNNDNTEVTTVR